MPFELNINTDSVVVLTQKLETLHRSGLPVAIRTALNSAAFHVKKETMPRSAKEAFINRSDNFFKATSRVEPAKGFDVRRMTAMVGFMANAQVFGIDNAVKDLEMQEDGGDIGGRSFVPLKNARSGGSWRKLVLEKNRPSTIANSRAIVDANKMNGKSKREKWNKAAIAAKMGGFVIGTTRTSRGNRILFRIDNVVQHSVKGKEKSFNYTFVKQSPIFAVKRGRVVRPKSTKFMFKASSIAAQNLETYFIESAKKQIERLT